MLDQLIDIDLSDEIDALPHQPGYRVLAERAPERYITLHYSGVPAGRYADRSEAAELRRILAEAREHLNRDWDAGAGKVYADGYMYDLVVLSNGKVVRTRRRRQQLWHAGNGIANEQSWSVHVLCDNGQDLTPKQRASLFRLFDVLRAMTNIARADVVGHNEWPRTQGRPQPSASFRTLFGQSMCPGRLIHKHLAAYRAIRETHAAPPAPAPATGRTVRLDLGPYTADSPILGAPRGTADQWRAVFAAKGAGGGYTPRDIDLIVTEYQTLGDALELDWFLALTQNGHETGYLTSWWSQRPRRNGAGLGVTGEVMTLATGQRPPSPRTWARDGGIYREGLSFTAWRDADAADGEGSISHHLGRLLAYALPAGAGTPLQQRYINRALALRPLPAAFRGIAPTLIGLNRRWAYPGRTYGQGLARIANIVRAK